MPPNEEKHGILDWIFDFFVSPISNAVKYVVEHPTKIIEAISPITAVHDAIRAIAPYINGIYKDINEQSITSPETAATAVDKVLPTIDTQLENIVTATMYIEAGTIGLVDVSPDRATQLPAPLFLQTAGSAIRETWLRNGLLQYYARYALKRYQPVIPEAYRLALAAAKEIIPWDDYQNAMAECGFNLYWAMMWQHQNFEYPDVETLLELLRRGVIHSGNFDEIMARKAFPKSERDNLLQLQWLIPPASDLVTMVVREAFDPKYVTPAPDIFAKYMDMKGFNKEWSDRYWTMHWVRIPLAQAYDNYYRGYWTKEQLLEELKVHDFHPDIREDIVNVAYGPPSIREMGYGFDVGVYSLEDITTYRRWGGLSPDDAAKSALAMVAYRTEAERNAVRTEYMYLYGKGKLSSDEFEAKLVELGTNEYAIPLWLERADAYKIRITKETTPEEPLSITRSTAQWLFEHGVHDETWLRAELKDMGYPYNTIDAYVAQSKQRIAESVKPPEPVEYRALTMTQLSNLYANGYITVEQLGARLLGLGYDMGDASLLQDLIVEQAMVEVEVKELTATEIEKLYDLTIIDSKTLIEEYVKRGYTQADAELLRLLTDMERIFPVMRTLYRNGWIKSTDLFKWLLDIGLPEERANVLMMETIKSEEPARMSTERDLTKAEIIKGVKNNVLTPSQGVELLMSIGYDESEAEYLLAINKIMVAGDPEGYWEMRKVTEAYKKAAGAPSVIIPDELIMLEREQRKLKQRIEELKKQPVDEVALGQVGVALADVEAMMRTIMAKLKLG